MRTNGRRVSYIIIKVSYEKIVCIHFREFFLRALKAYPLFVHLMNSVEIFCRDILSRNEFCGEM